MNGNKNGEQKKNNIFFVNHLKLMCMRTVTVTKDYKTLSYEPTFHSFSSHHFQVSGCVRLQEKKNVE